MNTKHMQRSNDFTAENHQSYPIEQINSQMNQSKQHKSFINHQTCDSQTLKNINYPKRNSHIQKIDNKFKFDNKAQKRMKNI